jgi:hypothetical protein
MDVRQRSPRSRDQPPMPRVSWLASFRGTTSTSFDLSLRKLAEFLVAERVVDNISHEGLRTPARQWAMRAGWGQSPRRRRRATYHRTGGVRHLFAAYDLAHDRLYGHRKRRGELLALLRYVRSPYQPPPTSRPCWTTPRRTCPPAKTRGSGPGRRPTTRSWPIPPRSAPPPAAVSAGSGYDLGWSRRRSDADSASGATAGPPGRLGCREHRREQSSRLGDAASPVPMSHGSGGPA